MGDYLPWPRWRGRFRDDRLQVMRDDVPETDDSQQRGNGDGGHDAGVCAQILNELVKHALPPRSHNALKVRKIPVAAP